MPLLKIGSRGVYVQLLQSTLNKLGYGAGEVDGIFGTRTENAVKRFQRTVGITVDGIVGKNTWNALMPYIDGYINYTVKSGDTFWQLAKTFGISVNAIISANPNVNPDNLQIGSQIVIPIGGSVVPTDISYSYGIMMSNIDSLVKRYPFLRVSTIGESVSGKNIPVIIIGNGPKKVCYNGSHHANEWITSVLLMKFIENFCRSYIDDGILAGQSTQQIFEECSIHVVPMVNPDGVDLVTGALSSDSQEYRNAENLSRGSGLQFPSGWKANIRGVDLNLNYPAEWEEARRIKFEQGFTKPGPRDYVGPSPFSEPESRAMGEYTRRNDFALTLAYHTQGEIIFWKFLNYNVPGAYDIELRFSEVSGYSPELTPINSGYAGYKDWFIQDFGRPGYTIEAGRGTNPLPISQFPQIYKDNIGILILGAVLA